MTYRLIARNRKHIRNVYFDPNGLLHVVLDKNAVHILFRIESNNVMVNNTRSHVLINDVKIKKKLHQTQIKLQFFKHLRRATMRILDYVRIV